VEAARKRTGKGTAGNARLEGQRLNICRPQRDSLGQFRVAVSPPARFSPVCTRRSGRVIVPIKPIGADSRDKFSAASAETSIATSLEPAKSPDNLNFEGLAGILGSVATGAASVAQKCVTCGFDSQARGLFSGGSPSMPNDGKWGAFVRNRFGAIQSPGRRAWMLGGAA
jgi:hypothetical protein